MKIWPFMLLALFSSFSYSAYFEALSSPPRPDNIVKKASKKFAKQSLKAFSITKDTLTPSELLALKGYSEENYRLFNEYLRDKTLFNNKHGDAYINGKRFDNIVASKVEEVQTGLRKMPRFQGKVYRGTLTKTGLIDHLNVGDIVYDPGFISTSVLPEVAIGFAEDTETTIGHSSTILEIDLTTNGYSVPAIAVTPGEAEVIVSPKTYMKVEAIATQGSRKLIALKTVESIEGHGQAYNLYTSELEAIQFVEPSSDALHLTCPVVPYR